MKRNHQALPKKKPNKRRKKRGKSILTHPAAQSYRGVCKCVRQAKET